MSLRDVRLSSLCHGQVPLPVVLPVFPRLDLKKKACFSGIGFLSLKDSAVCLLTSLNCITLRYASDLHSLNPALFDYICRYSN